MRFGVRVLASLKEQGYKIVPIDLQVRKCTDIGCAAALTAACRVARFRSELQQELESKHRQLADDHDPVLAAEYAAKARELAELNP